MKKYIILLLTTACLIFGIFSLLFLPFTNSESKFYSEIVDKISTVIIFTPEAAYAFCEQDVCIHRALCDNTSDDLGCNVVEDGCETYECGLNLN